MIVEEGGKVRLERYAKGHGAGKAIHIYSCTKSYFGVLAVIAEEEGLLSLDEKVCETIPEWRDDKRKSQITIRELLNFTSGLVTGFEEIYGPSKEDKLLLALKLKTKAERGDTFIYGPGNLQVFCEVLRRKLKPKGLTYRQYLEKKITRPLGISIPTWRADNYGNEIPSAGMWLTSRDMLKFGEMVSRGGEWNGRRIVKSDTLAKCFQSTTINPAFGLCFWTNAYCNQEDAREVDVEEYLEVKPMPENWSRVCLSKKAPQDLVCSIGSNFQRLYVVPSMDLVIVHQGKKGARGFRDAQFLSLLFTDSEVPESGSKSKSRATKPLFPKGFKLFKRREAE